MALQDPDYRVRECSASQLGDHPDDRAATALIRLISNCSSKSLCPDIVAAAKTLGSIGDRLAIEPLLDLLRIDYLTTQSYLPSKFYHQQQAELDFLFSFVNSVASSLLSLGVDETVLIPVLVNMTVHTKYRWFEDDSGGYYYNEYNNMNEAATIVLTKLSPPAKSIALEYIRIITDPSHSEYEIEAAIRFVAKLVGLSVPTPSQFLSCEDQRVRKYAAEQLGRATAVDAVNKLTTLLGDKYDLFRIAAAEALCRFGNSGG